eukprot:CAMPEP_0202916808 /NCGR_PEP_ID=MMETSP1392-20130828/69460_1 /ASSEMBLY_ACC=CAM_ASM_000868 /TAXON_ID=225041 /ORGANISM="Chlamydomonas chlamydogama, Strain SAG 11-48b" /LENGTH=133 /DNA_ID=CAMNT_0049609357 /DNA_START=643 /DNA_END=1044 /DNA_ORIENTATION=-
MWRAASAPAEMGAVDAGALEELADVVGAGVWHDCPASLHEAQHSLHVLDVSRRKLHVDERGPLQGSRCLLQELQLGAVYVELDDDKLSSGWHCVVDGVDGRNLLDTPFEPGVHMHMLLQVVGVHILLDLDSMQ